MKIYTVSQNNTCDSDPSMVWTIGFKSLEEAQAAVKEDVIDFYNEMAESDFDGEKEGCYDVSHLDFTWKYLNSNSYECNPEGDFDTDTYMISEITIGE